MAWLPLVLTRTHPSASNNLIISRCFMVLLFSFGSNGKRLWDVSQRRTESHKGGGHESLILNKNAKLRSCQMKNSFLFHGGQPLPYAILPQVSHHSEQTRRYGLSGEGDARSVDDRAG